MTGVERLAAKQDRESVRANLTLLEERGDLQRFDDSVALTDRGRATRDGTEAHTDAVYFAGWPMGCDRKRWSTTSTR